MSYDIQLHRRANKELLALPPRVADGIRAAIRHLATHPRGARLDIKILQGQTATPRVQRIRVGEYRVLVKVYHDLKRIRVLRIGHRRDVYRGLDRLD